MGERKKAATAEKLFSKLNWNWFMLLSDKSMFAESTCFALNCQYNQMTIRVRERKKYPQIKQTHTVYMVFAVCVFSLFPLSVSLALAFSLLRFGNLCVIRNNGIAKSWYASQKLLSFLFAPTFHPSNAQKVIWYYCILSDIGRRANVRLWTVRRANTINIYKIIIITIQSEIYSVPIKNNMVDNKKISI